MPIYANMGILRGRKGILGEEYGKEQLQRKNVIMCRACNLTAFIHSLTGPVGHPLLPVMRDQGSIPGEVLM